MRRSAIAFASTGIVLGWSMIARAEPSGGAPPTDNLERADTLFKGAKELRDAGRYAEACPVFAESQKLAPAIGVTLYLADCYEHTGRTASARVEFLEALKLAREKNDARADMALARARELDTKLTLLTVAVSPTTALPGSAVRIDGELLDQDTWNVALAVDPVDHVITLSVPGRPTQTITAHIAADSAPTIVQFDEAGGSAGVLPGAAPSPSAPVAPASSPAAPALSPSAPSAPTPPPAAAAQPKRLSAAEKRRLTEWYLLGIGIAGLGSGAAFLALKNSSMTNGGPNGVPQEDKGAAIASAVGFSVGAAAIVSAIVLYLATPHAQDAAFVVAPGALSGGAGGFVSARF
jgi:hypothetical protein